MREMSDACGADEVYQTRENARASSSGRARGSASSYESLLSLWIGSAILRARSAEAQAMSMEMRALARDMRLRSSRRSPTR